MPKADTIKRFKEKRHAEHCVELDLHFKKDFRCNKFKNKMKEEK